VLAFSAAATSNAGELYALGAVTVAFKALLIPLAIGLYLRNLDVSERVPSLVRVPTAVLLGIVLSAFAFVTFAELPIGTTGNLPLSALAVSVAAVLVAFLLMIVRPYAPSQLLGFLVLENGVTLASLVIAPGLPIILALLLVFDVLVGVLVFVVLVQYLASQQTAVLTDVLRRLRG